MITNTCCSLNCPFIDVCKEYNFLIERNNPCEHAEHILSAAERYKNKERI